MDGAAVDTALALLKSTVAGGVALQLGVKRDLEEVGMDLELLKAYLSDEERSSKDAVERAWARQARDVAYDVEDYVDGCRIHVARCSSSSWWGLWRRWSPHNIPEWCRITAGTKELRSKLEGLNKRRKLFDIPVAPPPGNHVSESPGTACSVATSSMSAAAGREAAAWARRRQNLRRPPGVDLSRLLLSSRQAGSSSLMVVSMCGADEAAAAAAIGNAYDALAATGQFPRRAWVTLQQHPPNPAEFARSLLRQFQANGGEDQGGENVVEGSKRPRRCRQRTSGDGAGRARRFSNVVHSIVDVVHSIEEMPDGQLLRSLPRVLGSKRYLLVLDDVSTREEWDSINLFLRTDVNNSSRIIVISPNKDVAKYCAGGLKSTSFFLSHDAAILPAFCNLEPVADEPAEASASAFNPENTASASREIVEITISTPETIAKRIRDQIRRRTIAGDEEVPHLVGRDKEMEWLVPRMMDANNENNNVLPICGMRGIGKTALVQNAYCHHDVSAHFTHSAWVAVPYPLNKGNLVRDILQQFKSNDPTYSRRQLQQMSMGGFFEANMGNRNFRCLVVVDGILSEEAWNLVRSTLLLDDYKAALRIIVTTRELQVASCCSNRDFVFNLRQLDEKDASKLFYLKVFGRAAMEVPLSEDMDKLKNQMLDICGGIPFAIVNVGLAASKSRTAREWESIINNMHKLNHRSPNNPELVSMRATLESCYTSLPYHWKYCFMYLSVFQEDLNIGRRRLLKRWIAEGYMKGKQGPEAEELGEMVFSDFLHKGIIQPTKYAAITSGEVTSCSVQPLMLELSTSKAKEEKLVCMVDNDSNNMTWMDTIRHVVVRRSWSRDQERYRSLDLSRVRSLTVFGEWRPFFLSRNMRVLRVLDLEGVEGLTWSELENIGEFQCLRYLGLRSTDIEHLPESVGKLQWLETLDIRHTKIRALPSTIVDLKSLLTLRGGWLSLQTIAETDEHMAGDPWGMEVPKDIWKLQEVKTLGAISIRRQSQQILQELIKLTQLQRLSVTGITDQNGSDLSSTLQHLSCLQSLTLQYPVSYNALPLSLHADSLRSSLERLQVLKLYGHLLALPGWVSGLRNLFKLYLQYTRLKGLSYSINVVAHLPNLTTLLLLQDSIMEPELTFKRGTFKQLKLLEFSCLVDLKSLVFRAGAMPMLKILHVSDCSNLENLLIETGAMPMLKTLLVNNCSNLKDLLIETGAILELEVFKLNEVC